MILIAVAFMLMQDRQIDSYLNRVCQRVSRTMEARVSVDSEVYGSRGGVSRNTAHLTAAATEDTRLSADSRVFQHRTDAAE